MANPKEIPIKNIYYMLCYAWNKLTIDVDTVCGKEKFDNIYNLMARVLLHSVQSLVQGGFHREYTSWSDELTAPRGRIDLTQSINRQSLLRSHLACRYDTLSVDVPFNQIIKATLKALASCHELDSGLKKEILSLSRLFNGITDVNPDSHMFESLHFNRNNQNYKLIIHVCQLVFDGLVSTEKGSGIRFSNFIRDRRMAMLYEKFVLNFYKRHLPDEEYAVGAPILKWKVPAGTDCKYLPQMRTDIVIERKTRRSQLIIDTKFYPEIFAKGRSGVNEKFKSVNLYQILTYVFSSSFDGDVSGMLLYPVTNLSLDQSYQICGKTILLKTLDLSKDWQEIKEQLLGIADSL